MLLEYVKKYERNSILTSILMAIVAILLITMPKTVLNTVIIVLGVIGLIDGAFHTISYVITKKEMKVFSNELFQGILEVIAGILLLKFKANIISIVPIIIGIWIIIEGIMKFQLSFNLRTLIDSKWILLLIFSIVSVILGVLIIINPFNTVMTLTVISGIFLLATAICNLIESIYVLIKLK